MYEECSAQRVRFSMNRDFPAKLDALKKVRIATRQSCRSLQSLLKFAAVLTLLATIGFIPVRQISAACALPVEAGSNTAAQCKSCCEEKPCCAAQGSQESHPLLPIAVGSNFQPGAVIALTVSHFLYRLPVIEKTFVYTSKSVCSHSLAPLALSCIQLV